MLEGCRIVVVEDDPIVSLDLDFTLSEAGAIVVGPFADTATALAGEGLADAAVLDVNLGAGSVFPLAERLDRAGVPILFHTGYWDVTWLRRMFPHAEILPKPSLPEEIVTSLGELLCRR